MQKAGLRGKKQFSEHAIAHVFIFSDSVKKFYEACAEKLLISITIAARMHGGLERFVVWRSINFWPFDTLCKLKTWYFILMPHETSNILITLYI
jgi:hypothetical protein